MRAGRRQCRSGRGAPDEGDDEPVHRDTPKLEGLDWNQTKESILLAEELGFDAAWAPDHLMLGRDNAEYEVWTLLSAMAGFTEDINIGSLVLCNDYRNPALVAKMAATLDVISEGRLELGLGAGWHDGEYEAYGWEYRDGFERLMRLDEGIRLIKNMWDTEPRHARSCRTHLRRHDVWDSRSCDVPSRGV